MEWIACINGAQIIWLVIARQILLIHAYTNCSLIVIPAIERFLKDFRSNYAIAIARLIDWLKNYAPVF